jgi:pilus assembly protein CpaC
MNIFRKALRVSALSLAVACAANVADAVIGGGLLVADAHAEIRKNLKMGLYKSAVVRLPHGVKDILVGNPKVADVVLRSRQTLYVFARKIGQTNIYLLDGGGNPVARVDIRVVMDLTPLQESIRKILPEADIHIEAVGNQLLLTGSAKTPGEVNKAIELAKNFAKSVDQQMLATASKLNRGKALEVVNAVRVTGKDQVTIKVKLAEVQRDVIKQLRTNLANVRFNIGSFTSFIFSGAVPFSMGNNLGNYGGNFSYNKGNTQVDGVLQALERDGLMRLLAEPTLTAISGESARFMAGGQVPMIVGYDINAHTYTYKLQSFGVMLGFSPVVLSEGRISLKVRVEVSELSGRYSLPISKDLSVPGIEKREAQTTVELPSGGTLALAGMIRQQTKQNIDGVPGLKNLPILGALFRSREFQSNQSELVVLATPYIVSPRNEKKFRTPVDGLTAASDYQTYFLGRLNRLYGGARNAGKGENKVYHGDVGFILE